MKGPQVYLPIRDFDPVNRAPGISIAPGILEQLNPRPVQGDVFEETIWCPRCDEYNCSVQRYTRDGTMVVHCGSCGYGGRDGVPQQEDSYLWMRGPVDRFRHMRRGSRHG